MLQLPKRKTLNIGLTHIQTLTVALTVLQKRREGFRSSTRAAGSANSIIDMNCIITEIKSRIESEPKLPTVRKFVQASHNRGEDPVKLWTRSGSESVSWASFSPKMIYATSAVCDWHQACPCQGSLVSTDL
ncbi:hypothetical protein SELMODRAFT_428685 [Selaginella moellendorffii]|uniref:Uncharacterized protein n=1 Tax=Selaginella moellendorffii TaxID=88036 RepID=D8T3Q1_SELML|nr:hypothetical protein SELMODRAFT_428685 [Selaginella moellendorffii]